MEKPNPDNYNSTGFYDRDLEKYNHMNDCSKHKKDVAGISDMKVLAEMIGDLHYETLAELLDHLSEKIENDSVRDREGGRWKIANSLHLVADELNICKDIMYSVWQISKPFMNQNKQP